MNEQIIDTLNQGREPLRLAVCAHEIGHALAMLAAGFQPDWVRLDFGPLGGLHGGRCQFDDPDPTAPRQHNIAWLIACIAGHAAETRFCQLYLNLDEAAAYRYGWRGSDGDYHAFHDYRAALGIRISHERAFQHATAFLQRHAATLDRYTLRLDRARCLTGAQLPTHVA